MNSIKSTTFKIATLSAIFIILLSIQSVAQEKLSSYNYNNTEISAFYEVEGKDKYDLWLYLDDGSNFIRFSLKDLPKARKFFLDSFTKFQGWAKIAEEYEVTDVRREITKAKIGNLLGFRYGSMQFSFGSVEVIASMRILDSGVAYCYFLFPSKVSSNNRYIKSETIILGFGVDEVDDFNSFLKHFDEAYSKKVVDEYNALGDIFH